MAAGDARTAKLASYFKSKGSPLAPYAGDFVTAADRWGLDWRLLPAISGIETSFGKAGVGVTGPFGYGSASSWGTPQKAIELAAKALGSNADTNGFRAYYKGYSTIPEIAKTWAPAGAANDAGGNAGWPSAVAQFFRELGGNPGSRVRGLGRNATVGDPSVTGVQSQYGGAMNDAMLPGAQTQGIGRMQINPQMSGDIKAWLDASENWAMTGAGEPDFQNLVGRMRSSTRTSVDATMPAGLGAPTLPSNLPAPSRLPTGGVDTGRVVRGGVGGNWSGSLDKALQLQALAGITPSSQKRSRQATASGGVSDHWQGSTTSYAIDLPGNPRDGRTDRAAQKIVAALGGPRNWGGGNFVTTVGGYRYQVIWKSNDGGNHYDHIHLGVRKV